MKRVLLVLGALLAGVVHAAGTVVAIGGALRDDNHEVWQAVVQAAGAPSPRFVVIGAASENPARATTSNAALLARHGARAEPLLDGEAQLQAAHGVYFAGGDQSRLVQLLRPGGRDSPLMEAIRALLARGGVVAGSSAGAAVMSEWMFTGGEPFEVLRGNAGAVHAPGLALVRPGVVVDQHFLKRGRIGRLLPLLVRERIALGIGVEEDSAAVIRGQQLEVIGARGVLLVDAGGARSDASLGAFNVQGAVLHFLGPGDRFDLGTQRLTAAPAKTRHVDAAHPDWRPYFDGEAFFPQMLGDATIVAAMTRLVDSRAAQVRGLAFEPGSELGFEWRLYRGADTSGWSVGDRYTLTGVRVDVQPVRMAQPLFRPWK